jgi:hypothetical protein
MPHSSLRFAIVLAMVNLAVDGDGNATSKDLHAARAEAKVVQEHR